MNDKEAIEMMKRASAEIRELRHQIDRLAPKAHAYEVITQILGLLPQRSQGYSEDLAYTLDRRIEELMKGDERPTPEGEPQ